MLMTANFHVLSLWKFDLQMEADDYTGDVQFTSTSTPFSFFLSFLQIQFLKRAFQKRPMFPRLCGHFWEYF